MYTIKFNLIFVALVMMIGVGQRFGLKSVSACKCLPLPKPAYCQTTWLAVLRITDVTANRNEYKKYYGYQILSDISSANGTGILEQADSIQTIYETAACGVFLEPGRTYLVGGNVAKSADENQSIRKPNLHSCQAYWRSWDLVGEQSAARIDEIRRECAELRRA